VKVCDDDVGFGASVLAAHAGTPAPPPPPQTRFRIIPLEICCRFHLSAAAAARSDQAPSADQRRVSQIPCSALQLRWPASSLRTFLFLRRIASQSPPQCRLSFPRSCRRISPRSVDCGSRSASSACHAAHSLTRAFECRFNAPGCNA
jgi:hypothetical protein